MTAIPTPLVLASTSPYRRKLLKQLGLEFASASPNIDEAPRSGEPAAALVQRLAESKARAVAAEHPGALIIGSDQVACLDDRILGKPGNRDNAIAQLTAASGQTLLLQTGLCLLDTRNNQIQLHVEPFRVIFRSLSKEQIASYVDREQPFDCAGGFKAEGLGICLFERFEGEDPNALIGLPLMRLVSMLALVGRHPLVS